MPKTIEVLPNPLPLARRVLVLLGMPTAPKVITPLAPSVSKVFEDFLARAEKDADIGPEVAQRLREALVTKQSFDSDSLSEALSVPE